MVMTPCFCLPRMQWCTRAGSMFWAATSSSSITTNLDTPPTPSRSTSTGDGSGRVRPGTGAYPVHQEEVVNMATTCVSMPTGHFNASFCPHAYGCRNVLVSENQIILEMTDHELLVTVQIPADRTLWLVSSCPQLTGGPRDPLGAMKMFLR